jgi:hypothetical protein
VSTWAGHRGWPYCLCHAYYTHVRGGDSTKHSLLLLLLLPLPTCVATMCSCRPLFAYCCDCKASLRTEDMHEAYELVRRSGVVGVVCVGGGCLQLEGVCVGGGACNLKGCVVVLALAGCDRLELQAAEHVPGPGSHTLVVEGGRGSSAAAQLMHFVQSSSTSRAAVSPSAPLPRLVVSVVLHSSRAGQTD